MNPFQAMQAFKNPTQFMNQQLQSKMQEMMKQNPQAYQRAMEMTNGKSETEMKQTAMNLASQKGIDLKSFASTFGIQL